MPDDRGVELRGITWDHERGRDPLLATAARFESERGIRVAWEVRSLQGFADASIPELAETYDLLVLDHPHIGEIVASGALLALDDVLDAAFVADQALNSVGPSHASYEWDGHLWALAIDAAGHVSAYRPDLLDREGLVHLPPVAQPDRDRASRRQLALVLHEAGRLTHGTPP